MHFWEAVVYWGCNCKWWMRNASHVVYVGVLTNDYLLGRLALHVLHTAVCEMVPGSLRGPDIFLKCGNRFLYHGAGTTQI